MFNRKMIRVIGVLVIALFTMCLTATAQGPVRLGPWQEVKTIVSVNSYATTSTSLSGSLTVLAATTDLNVTYHRILGFVVVPADQTENSELTIGLYDATTAATLTEANCFDEAEWDDDGNNQPRWYPYPKRLASGLSFIQGANTVVIIYYEDMRGQ